MTKKPTQTHPITKNCECCNGKGWRMYLGLDCIAICIQCEGTGIKCQKN